MVPRERDGVLAAELEAVVLLRIVRRRDHGPTRLFEVSDREVKSVRGDEPDVQNIRPGLGHALYESPFQGLARQAHVAPNHDSGARKPEVVDVGAPDLP